MRWKNHKIYFKLMQYTPPRNSIKFIESIISCVSSNKIIPPATKFNTITKSEKYVLFIQSTIVPHNKNNILTHTIIHLPNKNL